MPHIISGIQQVGIGVNDVDQAWKWYRRHFSVDVPVFREAAEAPLMTRYTGDVIHSRDAVLALNLQGGGGMEIWQYTSREPAPASFEIRLGDLGILAVRIKARDVRAARNRLNDSGETSTGALVEDPAGNPHFFVSDPAGLYFDVVSDEDWFARSSETATIGGVSGCLIGVSDMDRSFSLYREVLGYDQVLYDETGSFEDLASFPGGDAHVRRVLLAHSEPRRGAFSRLLGASRLELVQTIDRRGRPIFADRFWGDLGFIHLCFDVSRMDDLKAACQEAGFPFTVDSESSFDMGKAGGRFAYVEDPDGTLIEFVETHKVPIMAKWGWYLDLRRRPAAKPLPDWILRALGFNRVRD